MITSIEQIYDGLKDYINENIQDILEEMDVDEVKTPMFKQILRSSVLDIQGLKMYPTMMMEYSPITVSRETTTKDRYILPLSLYCISSGSNAEALQTKSERYVWALKKLFERDYSLDGLVDSVDVLGYEFSPALQRQQIFVHTGVVDIQLDVLINRK